MKRIIAKHFNKINKILLNSDYYIDKAEKISIFLKRKIKKKGKVFVCGNGGSFADASHFVGELTATYSSKNRKSLPFILLGSNQAAVTAWSNDFDYKDYLCREFSSLHNKNDVLFIFSTSGGNFKKKQSINLIKLAKFAKKKKIPIISLLGKGGGALKKLSDILIIVDSSNTASIQETHKIIFHSICETFEKY